MFHTVFFILLPLVAGSIGFGVPTHPKDVEEIIIDNYIIGGTNVTDIANWPWQGALFRGDDFLCGAVLVEPLFALTAAHCCETGDASEYAIRFGSLDKDNGGELVTIADKHIHPNWTNNPVTPDGAFPFDYAILRLETATFVGEPVYITEDDDATEQECYMTGWGFDESNNLPLTLVETDIDVITDDRCAELWNEDDNYFNNKSHVCVYDEELQAKGGCNGDSGGPLVCRQDDRSVWFLYGLNSWIEEGCDTTYPTVFARIYPALEPWLCTILPPSVQACG